MTAAENYEIKHYYVDEAGDPNLYKRRGKVIVGKDECSNYFILGLADVENPIQVSEGLEALRMDLLADPYFSSVPSFQIERGKTAVAFHAQDDLQGEYYTRTKPLTAKSIEREC